MKAFLVILGFRCYRSQGGVWLALPLNLKVILAVTSCHYQCNVHIDRMGIMGMRAYCEYVGGPCVGSICNMFTESGAYCNFHLSLYSH